MKKESLIITPRTRILELITAYPELEEVLVEFAPAFRRLKNPVLRRTIAKVTTLQQAAAVGNVKLDSLINRLRDEVGQETSIDHEESNYDRKRPEWFSEERVYQGLDAREMLEKGEHPVHQVMADLKDLPHDKIYVLTVPFLPAPLIDKAKGMGYRYWVDKTGEEEYKVYFGHEGD